MSLNSRPRPTLWKAKSSVWLASSPDIPHHPWNGAEVSWVLSCCAMYRCHLCYDCKAGQEGQNPQEIWEKVEPNGRIVLEEANGYPDSVLTITEAEQSDRAEYMCYAWNELGTSNSTVLVRVIGMMMLYLLEWQVISRKSQCAPNQYFGCLVPECVAYCWAVRKKMSDIILIFEFLLSARKHLGDVHCFPICVDKYAALWPFLGICAEVIVLCTIIFIFERRRSKKQIDESENEQNNA